MFKSTQNNLLKHSKVNYKVFSARMTTMLVHLTWSNSALHMGHMSWVIRHMVQKKKKKKDHQNVHHNFTFCHRCNRTELYMLYSIPPTYGHSFPVGIMPYEHPVKGCVHHSNHFFYYYMGNWIIYLQVIRISRYWIADFEKCSYLPTKCNNRLIRKSFGQNCTSMSFSPHRHVHVSEEDQ